VLIILADVHAASVPAVAGCPSAAGGDGAQLCGGCGAPGPGKGHPRPDKAGAGWGAAGGVEAGPEAPRLLGHPGKAGRREGCGASCCGAVPGPSAALGNPLGTKLSGQGRNTPNWCKTGFSWAHSQSHQELRVKRSDQAEKTILIQMVFGKQDPARGSSGAVSQAEQSSTPSRGAAGGSPSLRSPPFSIFLQEQLFPTARPAPGRLARPLRMRCRRVSG